jgi:hypothetical protein
MRQFFVQGVQQKCLNGFIISEVNTDAEQARGPSLQNIQSSKINLQRFPERGFPIQMDAEIVPSKRSWRLPSKHFSTHNSSSLSYLI